MLVSGGLVATALAKPSEGAIPVLFVGPLVFLGATLGLVAPGIALIAADDPKPQRYSVKVRPTLNVSPGGATITLAF